MYRKTMREALQEARAYRDPLQEDKGFSSKQIKQAYGVLNDPRYKQGNYDGAYRAIQKIAYGLADHPDVKKAMKRANEETITEFKSMTVTIPDPMKRAKAIKDIERFGKGTGFKIDVMGDKFKVDGKGADLNKFATDLKNFYGATVKAESLEEELDEALEVKWDSNKQGWFDKQGRRRYLGKMATNKLMSKAIDKAKETGDFINPFKLKHGQRPEETDLEEARYRVDGQLSYKGIGSYDGFEVVVNARNESDAEDKAYDALDKARDKRKIGPGGGGSIDDVEFEGIEKTNDRLSDPSTHRVI